jgi:hypothetical protein
VIGEWKCPRRSKAFDVGAVMHQGNDDNLRAMMQAVFDHGVY